LQCMKVHVSRNFFGSQIASFEQKLPAHSQLQRFGPGDTYRAIFIRAPAILTADRDTVTVLSEYVLSDAEKTRFGAASVIVAACSDNMLVTAFHPELTDDLRWYAPPFIPSASRARQTTVP
jgi:pyridoxal 5'-phosphate synthase pdxT subunit